MRDHCHASVARGCVALGMGRLRCARAGAARKRLRYRDAGFSDVAAPFFDDLLPAVAKAPVLAALPRPSPEGSALQRWAFDQGLRMGVLLSLRGGSDDEDDDAA